MSKRICLDAGHYGKYNRSPAVPSYYESEMNWKLHLKLKAALERYGFEVITTRPDQAQDRGLISRGEASKGCDLFLSIHSNAIGGSPDEATDYPLAVVQLDGKGDSLGKALAKAIENTMGTKQPGRIWTKRSDSGGEWYGVLRGAASVGTMGIILEHGFHTNTKATQWLLQDSNLDKLAEVEAQVIAAHFGVEKPTAEPEASVLYLVQAGAYSIKANAEAQVAKLKAAGFDAVIVVSGTEPEKETPAPAPEPPKKSVDEIAKEVIAGKWGNGQERKDRLTAAGYDYAAIQSAVNRILA